MRFKVSFSSVYEWFDRLLCTGCGVVGAGKGDARNCQGEAGYCCAACSGDTWRVGVMRWLCPEVMDKKVGGKDQWCWKSGALCIGVVAGGGINASLVQCCGRMVDRTLSCGWYEV